MKFELLKVIHFRENVSSGAYGKEALIYCENASDWRPLDDEDPLIFNVRHARTAKHSRQGFNRRSEEVKLIQANALSKACTTRREYEFRPTYGVGQVIEGIANLTRPPSF